MCRLATVWASSMALSSPEHDEALALIWCCIHSVASATNPDPSSGCSASMQSSGLALLLIGLEVLMLSSQRVLPRWLTDLLNAALVEVRICLGHNCLIDPSANNALVHVMLIMCRSPVFLGLAAYCNQQPNPSMQLCILQHGSTSCL